MAKDMIQVFCTKSIKFKHPKDSEVSCMVKDHSFGYAPSWIKDTAMFAALVREGSIKVIESAKDIAETETTGKIAAKELAKEEYTASETTYEPSETTEDLTNLSSKELFALCNERGIDAEAKQPKSYYLEKLID